MNPKHILIADRNPRIREFIRRELTKEGYQVQAAQCGREVLDLICHSDYYDLLILDPDLPDTQAYSILERIESCTTMMPIIIHSFSVNGAKNFGIINRTVFVEKRENSIEDLEKAIIAMLNLKQNSYDLHDQLRRKLQDEK